MKIKAILMASAFAAVSSTSFAADAIVTEMPPVAPTVSTPSFSWSGSYIGGQVGYGWGRSKFDTEIGSLTVKPDGFVGGIYAGYNFAFKNNVVLGFDTDVAYSSQKDGYSESAFGANGEVESKLTWSGAVRARAGVAVDRILPYIAGGVAFGNVENSAKVSYQNQNYGITHSKTLTGWTIGGGVDYAATENVIVRLEYRYTDFGKNTHHIDYMGLEADYKNKFTTHDVRVGVAYKF